VLLIVLSQNQQRRRTPGGVYLYLLRGDPRIPYRLVSKVFQQEMSTQVKNKKSNSAKKRLRRKAKLEALKQKSESGNAEDGSQKSSLFPNDPVQNEDQMEKDADDKESENDTEKEKPEESHAESDDDVDSDDYYGLRIVEESAAPMEENEDCIDVNCDVSDLQ
jgi:hypothetical protein